VLLPPTSPVRDDGSIDAAISLYEQSGSDSLVSVSEVSPLLWAGSTESPNPLYDLETRPRLQSVPASMRRFVENGSIVVTSIASLRATGRRIGGRTVMYVMSPHEGIDVDNEYDLWLASEWIAAASRR
jgi:CMP-N-acetylneuraminic acid synthetase